MPTLLFVCAALLAAVQTSGVSPTEGDFVIRNFRFASGETLPEVRMHYRTLGTPRRDGEGIVRNAVLILHGTGGTGAQFGRNALVGRGSSLARARSQCAWATDVRD